VLALQRSDEFRVGLVNYFIAMVLKANAIGYHDNSAVVFSFC